jgi:dTDP-4-dehydrorhamnose reductase
MIPALNVFITGGSGLLAVNWALVCRAFQNIVLGLNERHVDIQGVKTVKIRLDSPDELLSILKTERIDLVIHCAAITNVELCERDIEKSFLVNVGLTENVARVTQIYGCKLIYISTDMLFSGGKSMVSENEPVSPLNSYGKTKLAAERIVSYICPDSLIVRTNFYGWGTSYRKSFSDWIIESLLANREINLFTDIFFTPILLRTLVMAINALIGSHQTGIFHVVGNERVSKYEFGLRVAEKFGLNKKLIKNSNFLDRNDLVLRPLDMSLSNIKLQSILETSLPTLDDDLNDLLRNMPFQFREQSVR